MFETLRDFSSIKSQIQQIAETMKEYDELPSISEEESKILSDQIRFFEHSTKQQDLIAGSVKGGGDFPSVIYGSSYVYVTTAQNILFRTDKISGLAEIKSTVEPQVKVSLLHQAAERTDFQLDEIFADLCGMPVEEVIEKSDYKNLKVADKNKDSGIAFLYQNLIRPPESDSGNLSIQLKSTAEYGTTIKLIRAVEDCDYILLDGTLSLPFIGRPDASLFYEHLKRLCCVEARINKIGLMFLSVNHGIIETKLLENLAREKNAASAEAPVEHCYFRFPVKGVDEWKSSLTEKYRMPPVGAVTYLVWLHKNFPSFRIDLDRGFWLDFIYGNSDAETERNEQNLFEALDYLSHEQRSFGYPYPLKAVQNRVKMSRSERTSLRNQIIDECVKNGMKRTLFREQTFDG
jgi:hypothetical protein